MIDFQEKIAEAERYARILGIGQYKLYERIGVSAQVWSRLKSGKHKPNMRTWEKIEGGLTALAEEAKVAEAFTDPPAKP